MYARTKIDSCGSGSRMVFSLAILVLLSCTVSAQIGCIDDSGNPVDWFVALKAPKGTTYAYADSNTPQIEMSSNDLSNVQSAVGATLNQIYNNQGSDSVAYALYNDESPLGDVSETFGHTKGDICYDDKQGFWLIHSVPKYPPVASSSYSYPDPESIFGQSFICLTLDTQTIDSIGQLFAINKPWIYDSNLPDSLASLTPSIGAVLNGDWDDSTLNSTITVETVGGEDFVVFAKSSAWASNLYEDLVAPTLETNLFVETWMNGALSNKMPSFCNPAYAYNVVNVQQVQLPNGPSWTETDDHSKWAVSTDTQGIYCIGDINRQYSQANRGGGTVCGNHGTMWKSMTSLVSQAETC